MDTATLISLCANDVYQRFHRWVDRDDLMSEAHLWILTHPGRMAALEEDSKENPKRATYRLRRDIKMAMEIFARGEKAARTGYSPEDEFFYDRAILMLVLPSVMAGDPTPPSAGVDEAPRGRPDPAEGNNWLAMYADVERAWRETELDGVERRAVELRIGDALTYDQAAERMGVQAYEAQRAYGRAERRLVRFLGGLRPEDCPTSCECHDGPLRRRPGVRSNLSGADQLLG
jgi:hypothetical protein